MNKRKLAYLRRYLRVGSILLIIIGPVLFWLVLRKAKPYYANLPTLYSLTSEDSLCEEQIPAKASLLFLATHKKGLKYSLKIYHNLTEQLKDIKEVLPALYFHSSDTLLNEAGERRFTESEFPDFLRNCLKIEQSLTRFPVAIVLKEKKQIAGIYYLGDPFKRKRLKEDLSLYLFLKKHPEYEAKQKH